MQMKMKPRRTTRMVLTGGRKGVFSAKRRLTGCERPCGEMICASTADASSSSSSTAAAAAAERPEALSRIIDAFRAVPDPMQRYKQLLFFASRLPPLEPALKCDENKVPGCVSQVWMGVELRCDTENK